MGTIDAAGPEDDARDAVARQLTCIASIRDTRKLAVQSHVCENALGHLRHLSRRIGFKSRIGNHRRITLNIQ